MIKKKKQNRNWVLFIIASIVIVLNFVVMYVAIVYGNVIGWWAAGALIVASISSIWLSSMAILKNDPSWLMLDLILPG